MLIEELLAQAARVKDSRILPASGQPRIKSGSVLPADLAEFYSLCGGLFLFQSAAFPLTILPPFEFQPSNVVVAGTATHNDRSDDWYVLARSGADQFVSIDLNSERLGRCYDSFWDRHGVAGSCPVVARSFEELLRHSLQVGRNGLFWLLAGFAPLGDAYD